MSCGACIFHPCACGAAEERAAARAALRVYVAGGSAERFAVRCYMERLREAGIVVVFDWTYSPGYGRAFTEEETRAQAQADLDAVRSADVVWYLAPVAKSEGSHFELGAALALGRRVIVSGPATELGRIFPLLATVRFTEHEAALLCLVSLTLRRSP